MTKYLYALLFVVFHPRTTAMMLSDGSAPLRRQISGLKDDLKRAHSLANRLQHDGDAIEYTLRNLNRIVLEQEQEIATLRARLKGMGDVHDN